MAEHEQTRRLVTSRLATRSSSRRGAVGSASPGPCGQSEPGRSGRPSIIARLGLGFSWSRQRRRTGLGSCLYRAPSGSSEPRSASAAFRARPASTAPDPVRHTPVQSTRWSQAIVTSSQVTMPFSPLFTELSTVRTSARYKSALARPKLQY